MLSQRLTCAREEPCCQLYLDYLAGVTLWALECLPIASDLWRVTHLGGDNGEHGIQSIAYEQGC